jgi:hypothetical protein
MANGGAAALHAPSQDVMKIPIRHWVIGPLEVGHSWILHDSVRE